MAEQKPSSLKDIVGQYYEPEAYLSSDELSLIKSHFKDNKVIKVLRKILLPTVADPDMPLEELNHDAWLVGRVWSQIPAEQRAQLVLARQEAIEFILGGLIKLKVLANEKELSEEEKAFVRSKDSTK